MATKLEGAAAQHLSFPAGLLKRLDTVPMKTRMRWLVAAALLLLAALTVELLVSVRQQSQTFDESAHIYSGYVYWKLGDFGVNPEHPPLVKLEAALPLLPLGLPANPPPNIFFRAASAMGGLQFLYSHNADTLLSRARMATCLFTLLLAVLVFLATDEMFTRGAALIALTLLVLEPVLLANGALVTTDVAVSALLFGAIYLFYRYVKRPTVWRLIACGIVTGLALAAKHSALIIFPLLVILAAVDLALRWTDKRDTAIPSAGRRRPVKAVALRIGVLASIAAISIAVLWSSYGFRYAARPGNQQIVPTTEAYLQILKSNTGDRLGNGAKRSVEADVIGFFERHHLLPEAYLYGLTDILIQTQVGRPAFVFRKLYPNGRWFYFPAAFVIKTSIALMLLVALLVFAKRLRAPEFRREVLFMGIPPVVYFAVAMGSKMDIGIRHILPIYPFLIVLAGACAWSLMRQSRRWVYVVAVLLVFDAVSSLRSFPNYLPYSNEIWGGASNTHNLLSDSNVGWASGLKAAKQYLDNRHITQCWFAYDGPPNPTYFGIPCKPLPTFFSSLIRPNLQGPLPKVIQGPVLISSQGLVGFDFGPGEMNPYQQFNSLRPSAIIQGEILVYDGNFDIQQAAALSHFVVANGLFRSGHFDQAMSEAKEAEEMNPNFVPVHEMLTDLYMRTNQPSAARTEYETALHLFETFHPDFQTAGNSPPMNPFVKTASAGGGSH